MKSLNLNPTLLNVLLSSKGHRINFYMETWSIPYLSRADKHVLFNSLMGYLAVYVPAVYDLLNPIALRMAKTQWSFGHHWVLAILSAIGLIWFQNISELPSDVLTFIKVVNSNLPQTRIKITKQSVKEFYPRLYDTLYRKICTSRGDNSALDISTSHLKEDIYSRKEFATSQHPIDRIQANSADPDETPHNVVSHQGQHCLLERCIYFCKNDTNKIILSPLKWWLDSSNW